MKLGSIRFYLLVYGGFLILMHIVVGKDRLFHCDDGTMIDWRLFCNLERDCPDGSDELEVDEAIENKIECTSTTSNRSCLALRHTLCDVTHRCSNINPCDLDECKTSYFRCDDHVTCLPRSSLCDGDSCNDCHPDAEWKNGAGFKCVRNGRICLLPQTLLHDEIQDCDNADDFCYSSDGEERLDEIKCFLCLRDEIVIPRRKVCDGEIDCPDLSDECMCLEHYPKICDHVKKIPWEQDLDVDESLNPCMPGTLTCGDGKCVEMKSICDGVKDCFDTRDEDFEFCRGTLSCAHGSWKERGQPCRCYKECASEIGMLCDGKGDCSPPRGNEWYEEPGYPEDECAADCNGMNSFNCTHPLPRLDFYFPYQDFMDCYRELYLPHAGIQFFTLDSSYWCDGNIDCPPDGADEAREKCPNRFYCSVSGGVSIARERVCDGIVDCDDAIDEDNVTCSQNRHFCPVLGSTKISIDKSLVCDLNVNCDDHSDELNCHDDGRFYCESGDPLFVEKRQKFDGKIDCSDWSDECPIKSRSQIEGYISSKYELVATPFLRYFVWIMGFCAVVGNAVVIWDLVRDLRVLPAVKSSPGGHSRRVFKFNSMLVLNLACADLIMGVYLLILGVSVALHSGSYCSKKIEWLSGDLCRVMGSLVVVSSQTSVFTMVLLTTIRLIAVLNPFRPSRLPSTITLYFLILTTWISSVLIAVVPQLDVLQHVFQEEAVLSRNPFLTATPIHFTTAKQLAYRYLTFAATNDTAVKFFNDNFDSTKSWIELKQIMAQISNRTELWETTKLFGYYSYTSVCIPNIFVTTQEKSWWFSFSVSLVNFISFIYVAISYCFIYCKSNGNKKLKNHKRHKKTQVLQNRILRLVITDFLCWIPVCIMAFLNLSGTSVPNIAYSISGIILLPINSALNPILYSKSFKNLFQRIFGLQQQQNNFRSTTSSMGIFFTKTSARLGFSKKQIGKKTSVSSDTSVVSRAPNFSENFSFKIEG